MKISESVKKYSANIPEGLKNNKIFEKILQIEIGFCESTGSESDIIYIDEHFSKNSYIIAPDENGSWITIPKKDFVKVSLRSTEWNYFIYENIDFKELSNDTSVIMYKIYAYKESFSYYCVMACSTYQKDSADTWKVISNIHFQQDSPGFSNEELQNIINMTDQ